MISVDMLSGKRELKIRIIKDPIKLLMLLLLCEKNIIRYCVLVISMIPLIGSISSLVVPLLYCVLLLVIIKQKKDFNVRYKEFAVPFFILFSVLVTAIVYPENTDYLFKSDTLINTLLPCLKYYIIGLIIVIDAENMELACKASCVAVVIETLFVVLYLMPRGRLESEDMNRAYQILPNVMICIYYALHSKKAFPIIVGFLGIFYVIAMGSRGPVMIILAYIAGKILFTNAKKWIKFAVVLSILLAAIVFLNASVYLSVLNSIRNVFNLIGLPTRVLDYAINGTILSHMSERDILFRIALQRIIERPLWGYGVYGEWAWLGWNVHNMYLEFLVHYGVLLGSLLVIWLVGFVISTYLKTSSVECRELILIYSCLVFVRGFFGGSYLNYNTLFLVAVCFNAKRRICNVNAFQGSITKKPMASNT